MTLSWSRLLLWLVIGQALAACSPQKAIDQMTPHPESEQAQAALQDVRARDFEHVKPMLASSLRGMPQLDTELDKMAEAFPPGPVLASKIVDASTFVQWDSKARLARYRLSYEYQFAHDWVIADVSMARRDGELEIIGMHVYRSAQPLEQLNAFNWSGKPLPAQLFAVLAGLLALFSIVTFVTCLLTPIRKRKWLWAISTLIGVTALRLNWTTGTVNFQPLVILLFSSSATVQSYGPWQIAISIPIGAIVFWLKRKRLRKAAIAAQVEPPPLSSAMPLENKMQAKGDEDRPGQAVDPA